MGVLSQEFRSRRLAAVFTLSWVAVPLIIAAYLLARYVFSGTVPLVLAQVLFVGAAVSASVLIAVASRRAPRHTRARAVWTLLAAALSLLAVSEAIYAWDFLARGPGGMLGVALADLFNGGAAVLFVTMLAAGASVDRLGRIAATRLVIDLAVVSILSFAVLFRWSVLSVVVTGTSSEVFAAVKFAVYASTGILILSGVAFLLLAAPVRRFRPWDRLLGAGIGLYGLGVTLWPVWSLGSDSGLVPSWVEATVTVLYLIGYVLIALAGLQRVLADDVPWTYSMVARGEPVWLGQVIVSLTFASIGVLGWLTAVAPRGSAEESVYLVLLSVAAGSLVLRTALTSWEAGRLQHEAWTDEVTGAANVRALRPRLAELAAAAHRLDAPFILAVVDLDGFAKQNSVHGWQHGDEVLTSVARTLSADGRSGEVFRMSGDEFAVVVQGALPEHAESHGQMLVDLVARVTGLSASVGIVCCPSGSTKSDELIRDAGDACEWAKRHGKARVAVFDQRLRAALAVEDRLKPSIDNAGVDMARALAAATDVRDPSNYHHSRNVAALSVLLATELGLDPDHVDRVQIAATLHDVGKIALPDTMLGGRLVAARQKRAEQEHAALGERLLESLHLPGVPCWVRSHHERWDGQGYPDGLSAEQIPLESRIIALADAYDGMTAGKRYGAPMSKGAALQEIDLGIGARFDPHLAETFIRVVGSTSALGWADGWPAA